MLDMKKHLPLILLCAPLIGAQEEQKKVLEGHSIHGEAFNAGPRQAAYLMKETGRVKFPVTTKNPEAQKFINQGVGQLHGFWYFEAERSFRQAAALDSDCAIAYWGMAMANTNNSKRAKGFIAEAVKRKAMASRRERMFIDAYDAYLKADPKKKKKERNLAYTKALERILYEFPDDLEAKAFLCLQFWHNNRAKIPISHLAANALTEQILAVEPMHPVHHYRIHLWDYERPAKALNSAARCGQSSPSIAHMWHMPGHIYSRLKRYGDAAWQQEASARTDHAQMMRDRLLPDQIHNFAHNNEWLIRNLIFVGRAHDAVDLARNMIELPRHPKYNALSKRGSTYYGRLRLFQALTQFEEWDDLIALSGTPYLEPTDLPREQIKRLRLLGRAYFGKGDLENGKAQLELLKERLEKEPSKKKKSTVVRDLESATAELRGWLALAEGDASSAYAELKKARGLDPMVLASVRYRSGDREGALKAARDYVRKHRNEVLPLARRVNLLWKDGKKKDARKEFDTLRKISGPIDIDTRPFLRLAPVAKELGYPEDWRVVKPPPKDIGKRPDLDAIGPFRWSPLMAPGWTLKDASGKPRSLEDHRGRPVVVIFYLGFACLHCAEQLQAFGPKADAFESAGIDMIAISTDDGEGLKKSVKDYDKGEFPFPLVTDAPLEIFRKYRVYDDFEKQPLHGTFLIDGKGRVLWHDISYDPFMEPDFVLKEARRLLDQGDRAPGNGN